MPDFKVTLTRTVMLKGVPKALQLEHVVEDVPRPLAVLKSIGEIFEQESESGNHLIPKEAVEFWHEARTSGSLQEYELLSELENRWGITAGIQDLSEAVTTAPQHVEHRNGATPPDEIFDLDTMLRNQLRLLQARNAVLNADIEKKTAERDKNDSNIMRISQMLTTTEPVFGGPQPLGPPQRAVGLPIVERPPLVIEPDIPPKKRRGRPPKAETNATPS